MRVWIQLVLVLAAGACQGQVFSQRGFLETRLTLYPEDGSGDSGRVVDETLLRYEAFWKPKPWIKISGSFDARADTHQQDARSWAVDAEDRSVRRPAFSVRRLSATLHGGKWTVELGRQFVRWGKADILNPTDRFSPKDYLAVVDSDFLAILAARATYECGGDTLDFVWQPRFTPSRTPLLGQRWVVLPASAQSIPLIDAGSRYPGGSQFGARWNHVGRGYEFSLSAFDGHDHLPLFDAQGDSTAVRLQRFYPRLRTYGGDAAVPLRWFTVKAEAAYFTSPDKASEEYVLWVVQLERQVGEWSFVGGYAGDHTTRAVSNSLLFAPERGFAKSFLGRAGYNIDPNQSIALTAAVRETGDGSWLRAEYSRAIGQHWRATAGVTWIRGNESDFIGQYHRNSYGSLTVRYSF